jgi:hypothetical protein
MQTASRVAPRPRPRRPGQASLAAAGLAVVGIAWLGIAAASAWLAFCTPLLASVASPALRGSATQIVGSVVWAIALTAPACFAILGLARLTGALHRARGSHPSLPPVAQRAALLPPGCVVIPRIRLPDGRRIPDVVVGPHGVAIFERLPPPEAARRTGDRWEVRFVDRTWRSIENPLHRAARDAERLRRLLDTQDRDFVVRVQAAVIGDPTEVARADGCAVVRLDDVPAWIAALPLQRGLTPDRLAHVRELLEALA